MEERLLFHLRLRSVVSSSSRHVTKDADQPGRRSPSATFSSPVAAPFTSAREGEELTCTCIDSSSPSCIIVGFKKGVVHFYERKLEGHGDQAPLCEEALWKHSVLYPTRTLRDSNASFAPPDITCVQRGPNGILAIGTSTGIVIVMKRPSRDGFTTMERLNGSGFHHTSHKGNRVNCLLWDPSGDRLFSVCEGGTVVVARNLCRTQDNAPESHWVVSNSALSFWGMMPPPGGVPRRNHIRGVAKGPPRQAIIVGQLRSPGIQLDLGRVKTSLADAKPTCDVLLVMTRSKAVLLYFKLDQDVSTVAPYEATVDLNVLPPDVGVMAADAWATPGASDTRPAPPSVTDLGGCLWGPGVAASAGANGRTGGVHRPGALDQSLHEAWSDSSPRTPRPVLFAYIAQPGGKLWRVGLSDGEVESTHHPRSAAGEVGSSVRGTALERTASEGSLEIGLMQVVCAGKSQAILCWRHRPGEEEVTLSLLDCRTHQFGGVCRALPGVIGSSGSILEKVLHANMEPGPETRHRGAASDWPRPIRVLRGGTVANVTQLVESEDDITKSSPFPMRDDSTSYEARAEAAAIKVQRLWRHRRRRRVAQWKSSIIQTYEAQRPQSNRVTGSPSSSPANADVRTTSMVDTRPFAKDPNSDDTLDAAIGERHRDGFSIHDSLGALDAAERVLRLTSRSQDTGPEPSDVMTPPSAVTADSDSKGELPEAKSLDGIRTMRRSRSAASLVGTPEDGAKALVRKADALLRETAPVLRRSRPFVALSPSQGSPSSEPSRVDASEGWHGPTKGMEATARRAADEQRVGHVAEISPALPDEALAAQIRVNDTVMLGTVEDAERKWTEAVTGQGSSSSAATSAPVPPSPMPPEASRADEGVGDGRVDAARSKSIASSISTPERPEATRVPYPGGQDDVAIEPWSTARTRLSQPSRSGTRGYLHSSAPQKHLLTPVQDVVGSLFQRSVQAVNDALQPGGGAVSDDSSHYDDEDEGMLRHEGDSIYQDGNADAFGEQQEESLPSTGNPFGNDDSGVDGLTSGSITNNSHSSNWGSSKERSKDDSHQAALPAPHPGSSLGEDGPPASSMSKARIQPVQPGGDGNDGVLSQQKSEIVKRRGEDEVQPHRGMLFVSGMTGVKRQRLGVLRSRRNTRITTGTAAVRDLPRSATEDSSPFVPPSQYEVRLNVRQGLGLSIQITGNGVRVKGFSPVGDGEMGPAQACGQIQVGDALLRVNQEELRQLSHQNVVELLRGLLRESKDQVLLLRFAFPQDPQRAAAPQPPSRDTVPYPQHIHPSLLAGIPTDATRASLGTVGKDDTFRPDSWHGSRPAGTGTREQARSASPPLLADRGHVSVARQEDDGLSFGISRPVSRRYSSSDLMEDVNQARLGVEIGLGARVASGGDGRVGESGDSTEGRMGDRDYVSGTLLSEGEGVGGREREPRELWGQFSGGGISNRHVYLGDMGHARTQRTLGYIARDLQVLYRVRDASEISRFFHGGSCLSLVDPSPSASDNRSRPPSVLLPLSNSDSQHYFAQVLLLASSSSPGEGEPLPPLPRGLARGRRRKRTPYARNRESSGSAVEAVGLRSDVDEDGGERIEEDTEQGGEIHLSRCEKAVTDELRRLETGLEEQTGRLASWDQKSGLKRLVAKILQQTRRESADGPVSPDGRPRETRRGERSRRENRSGDAYGMSLGKGGKGCNRNLGDGLMDSDHEGVPHVENARRQGGDGRRGDGVANMRGELSSNHDAGDPASAADGGHYHSGGHTGPEPACDIFSEGVLTAAMRQELLSKPAVEMLGAPPRSLPTIAYDLQTALESVQHLATETLNEVVHSKATRGLSDERRGVSLSPTRAGRSGFGTNEAKEAAAAAALGSGWESAWPPRELTAALGLVTARQMAHAMRCDSEPLFQIWMRYFTPLDVKYRDKLWGALDPSPTDSSQDISGIFHRQLVCGLITLYAQVHISWPFLACPADDPSAVGLRSLRLGSTWFSIERDSPDSYGHASNILRARFGTMDANNAASTVSGHGLSGGEPNSPAWGMDSDLGAGSAGGGDVRNGGLDESTTRCQAVDEWDEERTNAFIEEYGCYLDADAIAASASCREMAGALHSILRLAEKCENYKVKERILHQLLRGPRTPVLRSPMIGPMPMPMPRSPSVTSDARTPTVISPASASMHTTSRPTSISPTALSAAIERTVPAAVDDLSRPMEEDAVRKALGLPPSRRGMPVEHGRGNNLAQAGQLHEPGEVGATATAWGEGGNAMGGTRDGDAGVDELAGSAPLCLLLSNLVDLFRWDVASAAEICADVYPGIRPWNVYLALYQDAPWSAPNGSSTPNTGGPGRGYHTSDESGIRNDAAFHAYLWAMMEGHPRQCRQDWKMVQRCLQLSLRIAAKLQQLPRHHPLHGFCRAATRNVRCSPELYSRRGQRVPGHRGTLSMDLGDELMSLGRGPAGRRVGSGEGVPESGYLFDAEAGVGESMDVSAYHRYSHIVEVVATKWCEDPDAFAVDPLWLLQKLRAFRKWSLAFQVCSGVTRSWEESSWMDGGRAFDAHDDRLGTHGMNLASSLAVLDTLMDACLASFWEGNVACLGSALGALWAAEGALQNVGVLYTRDSFSGSGDGKPRHPTGRREIPSSESNERRDEPGIAPESSIHGVSGAMVRAVSEHEAEAGGSASQPADDGAYAAETGGVSGGTGGDPCLHTESSTEPKTSWVEDSRTMDVIRNLTEKCRDYLTPDEAFRDAGAGEDVPGEGRGGWGPSAAVGDGLEPTLSLLDLGKAVVDGLGPEAAADVLADCPRLIDRMSPEFFRILAERRAALCQQEALEAVLLHQATARAWALGGMAMASGTSLRSSGRTSGARDGADRLQPLGARLAWLACEEITCFFHQNENPLPQAGARGGPRRSLPRGRGGHRGAARRLFSKEEGEDDDFGNSGHVEQEQEEEEEEEGNRDQGERARKAQEAVHRAVAQSGLDVLFAGHAHHGTTLLTGSPCALCGLSLHDIGRLPSLLSGEGADLDGRKPGPDDDGLLEIVVARCGRGYHVRCLEECMPTSHN